MSIEQLNCEVLTLAGDLTDALAERDRARNVAVALEQELAAVHELIAADPDEEMVHSVAYQTARHERTGIALVAAQAVMRELRVRLAAAEHMDCKPDCIYSPGHDGDCLDDEDVAEEKLRARDYEAWAAL